MDGNGKEQLAVKILTVLANLYADQMGVKVDFTIKTVDAKERKPMYEKV